MNVFINLGMRLLLFSEVVSSSFSERTIHINSDTGNPEIRLYCQSDEKYYVCQIGKVLPSGNTSNSCTFYKSTHEPSGDKIFKQYLCTPKSLIEQIEYKGMAQTDTDCMLRITNFDTAGNKKSQYDVILGSHIMLSIQWRFYIVHFILYCQILEHGL